jgi:hypothetical protein
VNAVVELKPQTGGSLVSDRGRMAVADVVQQAMAIQEVMKAVMRENVHYGVIPGTDKPTLYKAGAEKLCLTFHVADEYRTEDLSTSDAIRYRLTCIGRHQQTGIELGSGVGEASTSEEKYRWRRAVCKEEFEATPVNMRRVKYGRKSGGGFYTQEQVRTEPADLANTVLKMAAKRAKMAMVLNVLAASDAFTQDLEDLSEELREHLTEDERDTALQTVRDEWLGRVKAVKSLDELTVLASSRGPAVAAFQKAKDTDGYAQFKTAVQARGAELRATQAPAAPPKPPAAPPAAMPPVDDPFVTDMEAEEGRGHA